MEAKKVSGILLFRYKLLYNLIFLDLHARASFLLRKAKLLAGGIFYSLFAFALSFFMYITTNIAEYTCSEPAHSLSSDLAYVNLSLPLLVSQFLWGFKALALWNLSVVSELISLYGTKYLIM